MNRARVGFLCLAALLTVAGHARAADPGATYPAGSITTREQAEEALAAVRAAQTEAETAHREELKRCATVFLVNKCTGEARRKFDAQKREFRRVEIEARDVRRRIDADERAAKRSESEAKQRSQNAPNPAPDPDARAAQQAEKDKAATANREQYQQKQKAHAEAEAQRKQKEAAEAGERAENVKAYEDKQREAAAYAKRKEEERIANEKRRENRRIEREKKQKALDEQAKR
jgi:hypothetical protein